jgi:hypothetical protein
VVRAEELSVELISVVMRWQAGNGVITEAEYSPMLEAVTRKRLVTTLHTVEDIVFSAVICNVWRLAVALLLLIVPSLCGKMVNKSSYQSKSCL